MELKVPKATLAKILARVTPAVGEKSPMSILKCVLLRAEANGRLSVLGTDLVTAVTATATVEVAKPGACAIPARWLADVVSSMPSAELSIAVEASSVTVKAVKAKAKAKGPCLSAEDFPEIPTPENGPKLQVQSSHLARMIARSSYAQSDDETRASMACTRIECDGKALTSASVDGHRLGIARIDHDGEKFAESIPSRSVKLVAKLCAELGEQSVTVSRPSGDLGYLHFAWSEVEMSTRRGDQAFPPYQRVVPTTFAHRVQVTRQGLVDAIKRAQVASATTDKSKVRSVRLDLSEGSLVVSAETSERGSASDEIDVAYAGKPWAVGAASEYLLDALAAIDDDDVMLCISGPLDPLVFVGAVDERAVMSIVMPMRV